MQVDLPSSRQLRRQANAGRRLLDLLDLLGVVDRRAPLPPREAGDARRTLGDVAAAIGGGCEPPAGTRRPADIFVSTLMGMEALNRLNRLQQKAYWRAQKKRYPRSLRRP